jgi:hypothetical protein
MSAARLALVADAIADLIRAASLSQAVNVSRVWVPTLDLAKLTSTPSVLVVPIGREAIRETRGPRTSTYRIDIAIAAKPLGITDAMVDTLAGLAVEITALFDDAAAIRATVPVGITELEHEPAVDADLLASRAFASLISLTARDLDR